jgi:hypothetical protein
MSGKLITVATYWDPIEAGLARGRLEAAGIRSFVADEQMVGTAWYLGNAIGGVKLQVGDSDAEAALDVLSEVDAVDEDFNGDDDSDEPAQPLSNREENADRAYRSAIIGLLFPPLQLYVIWLLIGVYGASDEPLCASKRRAAIWAAAISIPSTIAIAIVTVLELLYDF